jgi:hypothetical protein
MHGLSGGRRLARKRASSDPTVGKLLADEGPNERECIDGMAMWKARRQMPAQAGRSGAGRGEAASEPGSDEAIRPRHGTESTMSCLGIRSCFALQSPTLKLVYNIITVHGYSEHTHFEAILWN